MPLFLRKYCPASTIENVELDPLVLRMAVAHFGFPPPGTDGQCVTHISDAADFVIRMSRRLQQPEADAGISHDYDAIMVDLYTRGGEFPPQCLAEQFMHALMTLVKRRKGLVVLNIGRSMPGYEELRAIFAK